MSDRTFWQCLSVQKFFSSCNWQGHPLKIEQQLADISFEQLSLCLTVQEYFSHSNWQGQLLGLHSSQMPSSLSLTLPVGEFFQFIVWEGNPKIAALPKLSSAPELTPSPSQDLTLTDFSELF
ncbi:MAG: hypothetical protein AB4426_02585 [Xenococcaceae cyanobacterium]